MVLLLCLTIMIFFLSCPLLDRIAETIALKQFFLEVEFSRVLTACLEQA
ncbi:hypothetical protein [Dethiosulfatarculus sandiegensis]|uniref:Uncharacterized protein n=1 Tax=Dethiosulfatarculus sandiegensis TaxID=1429043 RepID=A0A0D2HQ25_9BACT|nr:hypothetical protein [Dethiosulfatarculus sandiegensis]KIX12573.1 hypothetical protein X474_18385 [Dethiosulfatarculus sandiegensis]